MKAGISSLAALLTAATLSGCGTLQCCTADDQEVWPVYGGVQRDAATVGAYLDHARDAERQAAAAQRDGRLVIGSPPGFWYGQAVMAALDVPLSAAADTLLLPVTVTYSVAQGLDRVDDAPPLSAQAWQRFWGIEQPAPPSVEPPTRAR